MRRQAGRFWQNYRQGLWMTKQMAENIDREQVLNAILRESFFYGIFIILITIVALGMIYSSMYYLTKALQDQFVFRYFKTVREADINLEEIRTPADFWAETCYTHKYTQSSLLDALYWDYWYDSESPVAEVIADDKKVLYDNVLLSAPRIRQLRVRSNSCKIHEYFRRLFISCYDSYSTSAEDRTSFGPENGTAWEYHTSSETQSTSYWGQVATYDGGGYYQDLSLNRNETEQILEELRTNLWISRATRCIFIDFTIYNANLNLFSVVKLVFEFPSTGGVLPSYEFHSLKLIRYVTAWDYFVLACEFLFFGFLLFYTVEEIREAVYLKWDYLTQFWTYVDVLILILGYSFITFCVLRGMFVTIILRRFLPRSSPYLNFEVVGNIQINFNNLVAVLLFIVYVKIFKYINFSKTLGQLNNTLKRCAMDILVFSVMFFLVFFAFAELGYLLFGTQVESFSSFGVAMFTLLRTILGDFDYKEIESANRIFAPIFFVSYIFFVFFVLLNMFLAIINDTYADVKTEIDILPDELQMVDYLKRGFYNLLGKCKCFKPKLAAKTVKNEFSITVEQIRGALKKCDFTELEIEMFFSRYNIDPTAEVGEADINRLIADLEGKSSDRRAYEGGIDISGAPLVTIDNFIAQQERLSQVERNIGQLVTKVDALLKKLDSLENVRKTKK